MNHCTALATTAALVASGARTADHDGLLYCLYGLLEKAWSALGAAADTLADLLEEAHAASLRDDEAGFQGALGRFALAAAH